MKTTRIITTVSALLITAVLSLSNALGGTVEKKVKETIIPAFQLKESSPAKALEAISAHTGIEIFYTPRKDDQTHLNLSLGKRLGLRCAQVCHRLGEPEIHLRGGWRSCHKQGLSVERLQGRSHFREPRIMKTNHRQDIDVFWSLELALPNGFQSKPGEIHVRTQEFYSGVQFFLREDWLVIAAPPQRMDEITGRVCGVSVSVVFNLDFVARMLSPHVGKILGPAHVSYADDAMFRRSPSNSCRVMTSDDAENMHALASCLSNAESDQSGFDADKFPAFGAFAADILCAVASYQVWEPRIAHITVATHPAHRRQGHARATVSALAEHALAQGFVLQYRALETNGSSLALGRSMGFEHHASTIYARPAGA